MQFNNILTEIMIFDVKKNKQNNGENVSSGLQSKK